MKALKYAIYPLVCAACVGLAACQPEATPVEKSSQMLEVALQQADDALSQLSSAPR